jgi:hypothetical protein
MTALHTPAVLAMTPELAAELVETAGRAPSVHNTQPWRFRLDGVALELRVDPERHLPVADPQARELVISCGAALFNLRLAARCKGLVPHVDVTPASGDPLLLARITVEPGALPTADEHRLMSAVVHRHTQRHGFSDVPVAQTLWAAFEADVAAEGARVVWLDRPAEVAAVVDLSLLADRVQVGDAAWQQEVARWVRTAHEGRRDGIPLSAIPTTPTTRVESDRLPTRSFVAPRPADGGNPREGVAGRVALILTADDLLPSWLAAGQGLQRMLLRAADDWVFATYATGALENPVLREALRDRLDLRDIPQMVMELGHSGTAKPTPRLPTAYLLDT